MNVSKIISSACVAALLLTGMSAAQANQSAPALQRVGNEAFAGQMPVGWRVNSYHFRDFVIYQVLDGISAPANPVEVFGVYHGSTIEELNLTSASREACERDGISVLMGRSEATETQSGMTHLLVETSGEEGADYVHLFSTMLDMTDADSLAAWNIVLNVEGVELADLICSDDQ